MPLPKSLRRGGHEKNKMGRLSEKASSFHGRGAGVMAEMLPRPRTVPDLLTGIRAGGSAAEEPAVGGLRPKLTKLLLHVTVLRSPGALHVLMPPEATVEDLIAAALREYVKEARRPVFHSPANTSGFNLHYSQFSLECLDKEQKLVELGSRNFFLCPAAEATGGTGMTTLTSSCSKEAEKGSSWLKFIGFLLD